METNEFTDRLPVADATQNACSTQTGCQCCRILPTVCIAIVTVSIAIAAYFYGRQTVLTADTSDNFDLSAAVLNATATHGGADMAVATGLMDEDSEGLYTLDFKTGELTCFVYYPRMQRFGGMYKTNVTQQLAATRNAEYLMVTGRATTPSTGSTSRPALSLVYVVDTKSGQFAAYGVPLNRTLESSGQLQAGQLAFVHGGEIRPPSAGGGRRTLPPAGGVPAGAVEPAPGAPGVAPPEDPRKRRQP